MQHRIAMSASQPSMGGEAFGPTKASFPSVGERQDAEVGEGGWERKHFGGNGRGERDRTG